MSDLISRQAAIDAARDWYEGLICGSFKGLEKRLRALPSAQSQRMRGKWTYGEDGSYKCDYCGNSMPHKTNYCPNCGAKMDGGDL